MSPQNAGSPSVPMNIAEMMVAIGRIEEKVNPVEQLVTRLAAAEADIKILKETKRKPITFGNVLTLIAASVAIMVGLTSLQAARDARTEQAVQIQLLQKNQQELQNKVKP